MKSGVSICVDACSAEAGSLEERQTQCQNGCKFVSIKGDCLQSCGDKKYERTYVDGILVHRCLGSARCPAGYFETEEDDDLCVRSCSGKTGFLDVALGKCVMFCPEIDGIRYFSVSDGQNVCETEKCAASEQLGPGLRRRIQKCT